jgi:hypothetical protein
MQPPGAVSNAMDVQVPQSLKKRILEAWPAAGSRLRGYPRTLAQAAAISLDPTAAGVSDHITLGHVEGRAGLRVRSARDMRWSPNSRTFAGLPGGLAWSGLRPATYSDHRVCVRPELGRTAAAGARCRNLPVALPPTLPPEHAARTAKREKAPVAGALSLGPPGFEPGTNGL